MKGGIIAFLNMVLYSYGASEKRTLRQYAGGPICDYLGSFG